MKKKVNFEKTIENTLGRIVENRLNSTSQLREFVEGAVKHREDEIRKMVYQFDRSAIEDVVHKHLGLCFRGYVNGRTEIDIDNEEKFFNSELGKWFVERVKEEMNKVFADEKFVNRLRNSMKKVVKVIIVEYFWNRVAETMKETIDNALDDKISKTIRNVVLKYLTVQDNKMAEYFKKYSVSIVNDDDVKVRAKIKMDESLDNVVIEKTKDDDERE